MNPSLFKNLPCCKKQKKNSCNIFPSFVSKGKQCKFKNMKRALTIILIFLILGFYAKAQQQEYPFTVQKSGSKGKNIILIPGFMSSAAVWSETVDQLNKSNTCYVLQMAGFAGSKAVGQAKMSSWRESIANYIKD